MAKRKTEQTISVGNIDVAGRADVTELAEALKDHYAAPPRACLANGVRCPRADDACKDSCMASTARPVDLSDIEAIEREAEQHAQPTPLIVRAMCAVVRELRLQRLGPGERRG